MFTARLQVSCASAKSAISRERAASESGLVGPRSDCLRGAVGGAELSTIRGWHITGLLRSFLKQSNNGDGRQRRIHGTIHPVRRQRMCKRVHVVAGTRRRQLFRNFMLKQTRLQWVKYGRKRAYYAESYKLGFGRISVNCCQMNAHSLPCC